MRTLCQELRTARAVSGSKVTRCRQVSGQTLQPRHRHGREIRASESLQVRPGSVPQIRGMVRRLTRSVGGDRQARARRRPDVWLDGAGDGDQRRAGPAAGHGGEVARGPRGARAHGRGTDVCLPDAGADRHREKRAGAGGIARRSEIGRCSALRARCDRRPGGDRSLPRGARPTVGRGEGRADRLAGAARRRGCDPGPEGDPVLRDGAGRSEDRRGARPRAPGRKIVSVACNLERTSRP